MNVITEGETLLHGSGSWHAPRELYIFCVVLIPNVSNNFFYMQKKEGCSSVTCFYQINQSSYWMMGWETQK